MCFCYKYFITWRILIFIHICSSFILSAYRPYSNVFQPNYEYTYIVLLILYSSFPYSANNISRPILLCNVFKTRIHCFLISFFSIAFQSVLQTIIQHSFWTSSSSSGHPVDVHFCCMTVSLILSSFSYLHSALCILLYCLLHSALCIMSFVFPTNFFCVVISIVSIVWIILLFQVFLLSLFQCH